MRHVPGHSEPESRIETLLDSKAAIGRSSFPSLLKSATFTATGLRLRDTAQIVSDLWLPSPNRNTIPADSFN